MGLSKKTLLYSTFLSVIIVSCMAGYFIWMLPSLYINYRQEQNFEIAVQTQKAYIKNRSYENLEVSNPMTTYTIEIPLYDNNIKLSNQFFGAAVKVEDEELCKLLDYIRQSAGDWKDMEPWDSEGIAFSSFSHFLTDLNRKAGDNIVIDTNKFLAGNMFEVADTQFHIVSDNIVAFETSVTDGVNFYTTYMLIGTAQDDIIMTFVFLLTPQMDEIRPVVLRSLPMIIAVSFLVVLIFSQIFSRFMIQPILRLAHHARSMKEVKITDFQPIEVEGKDEISDLSKAWNELHQKLVENYRLLEAENKRQEVFLRASSHQLKTPVAAALLLAEGMIHEVGKYRDVKTYLPQLKEQLLLMQKMTDDILSLEQYSSNMEWEMVSLPELVKECVEQNRALIEKRNLKMIWEGEMPLLKTDISCMQKVVGNILSNAICYTPVNESIKIIFRKKSFSVINYGGHIEAELLPHIFDPFVTSNSGQKGRGLGLYVVAYYSPLLGCEAAISNIKNGVEAKLTFK